MGAYFEPILVMALIASFVIGLVDKLFFEKTRKTRVMAMPGFDKLNKKEKRHALKAPLIADYARELFLVFLFVFLFRGFVAEIYVVPTGSMLPTIQLDEFFVINKFVYGLRNPFSGTVLVPVRQVERGDVFVFRYPANPQVDFIKRVIGLPGDHISYIDKQLYINGVKVPTQFLQNTMEPGNSDLQTLLVSDNLETLGKHTYHAFNSPDVPAADFQNLVVPQGDYFAMGDNRDNSEDSRFWGMVSDKDVVGKAGLVFFSWDSTNKRVRWSRIGHFLP